MVTKRRGAVAAGVVAAVMVFGSMSGAGAAGAPRFSLSPTKGYAGVTRVTASSVTPCPAGAVSARVAMSDSAGRDLISVSAPLSSRGSWTSTFVVPSTATPGQHNVTADCRDANNVPVAQQQYRTLQFLVRSPLPPQAKAAR